jgi:hypothetical protein
MFAQEASGGAGGRGGFINMAEPIFSERQGLAPRPDPQADDYLPPWVRETVANEIRNFIQNQLSIGFSDLDLYSLFRPYIWKVLQREPPTSPVGGPWAMYIPRTLAQCSWWQFYDILEQISQRISQRWGEECISSFSEKINAVLARDGIPWRLDQGRVVRTLSPQVVKQIQEARTLLANPRFKGPDAQFTKAVEYLNKRPDPDEENCVKDAVGAMEAVANIIAGAAGVQLNTLLDREPFRSAIHPTIRKAIDKIYAYRGAAPGVGHGQVGPSTVGLAEAIWVLATSAATILYFVSKFPD